MEPVAIAKRLVAELRYLHFAGPVTVVYNPLDYAFATHRDYLERYCRRGCAVVLVGMNPGPWGMAQTGVPFGEVEFVRDWMGIKGDVKRPPYEHPKRPIHGFECRRREVSGARLWGWARERFGNADTFFQKFFVANYCPLAFMEASGRNRTPDKLPAVEKTALFGHCNRALRDLVTYIEPKWVIGIGAFAEERAREALDGVDVKLGRLLHPSPASPIANRGWAQIATRELRDLGITVPGDKGSV